VAFAALGAGLPEVEVLDGDGCAAVLLRDPDQRGDGGAEPPVALGGGESVEFEGDGVRVPGGVAVRQHDQGGEVAVVEVGGEHRSAPQVPQGGRRAGADPPRRRQVPAAPPRVERDVVTHRSGLGLRGDLPATVRKAGLAVQPVPAS
jgi:hypothetical protein